MALEGRRRAASSSAQTRLADAAICTPSPMLTLLEVLQFLCREEVVRRRKVSPSELSHDCRLPVLHGITFIVGASLVIEKNASSTCARHRALFIFASRFASTFVLSDVNSFCAGTSPDRVVELWSPLTPPGTRV